MGNARPQIVPVFILLFDQFKLPRPLPALHALFPGDGFADIVMNLKPYEPMDAIFRGKSRHQIVPMFINAFDEIIRHADV